MALVLAFITMQCNLVNIAAPNPIEAETQDESDILTEEAPDMETREAEEEMTADAEDSGNEAVAGGLGQVVETVQVGTGPMVVTVYGGDASKFGNQPEMIIYANAEYVMPPEGFQIRFTPESTSFYQWRNLENSSQWIEISSSKDVSALGVQFFADKSQGWVRLLLDGGTVWQGDTYGRWTDGNNWACYVEISGISQGAHTLRVENLGKAGGGGGQVVAVYFFGFRFPKK